MHRVYSDYYTVVGKHEVINKYNAGTLIVTCIHTVVCKHDFDNKYNTVRG